MKLPRQIAALVLLFGIMGLAAAGSFTQRRPEAPHVSEAPPAVTAEPIAESDGTLGELPHLGAAFLLGGGLGGLALLGRKRLA